MTAEETQALFWCYADSVTALYENDADMSELEPYFLKLLALRLNSAACSESAD